MFESLLARMPEEIRKEIQSGTSNRSTLLEMQAESLNSKIGDKEYLDCPICKNKGFVAYIKDDRLYTKECECEAKRRTLKRITKSGLRDMVERYTFDKYETPNKWHEAAKTKAMEFITNGNGKWFMISGTPGTGKTHICVAIAGELMKANKEVRYFLWRDEAPKLKALVNDREEYERIIEQVKRVDVLYIDDFFKGTVTPADINLAFEILNSRYNSDKLITIISTEMTIENILSLDEAVGSRIYERCKGFYIKTPKDNWRLR